MLKLSLGMGIPQAAEEGQAAAAAVPSRAAQKRARKKAAARAAAAPPATEPPAAELPERAEVSSTADDAAVQTVQMACNSAKQGSDTAAMIDGQDQQQQQTPAWSLCPITKVCTACACGAMRVCLRNCPADQFLDTVLAVV